MNQAMMGNAHVLQSSNEGPWFFFSFLLTDKETEGHLFIQQVLEPLLCGTCQPAAWSGGR